MLGWSSDLGTRLFGADPKLEFCKQGQGLDLLRGNTIPSDSPYWRQYLDADLFGTQSDTLLLLPAAQIDRALRSNPLNIVTLIRICVDAVARGPSPDSSRSEERPPNRAGSARGAPRTRTRAAQDRHQEALTAVGVLTRVVPLVLAPREPDGSPDAFEEALFWTEEAMPVDPEREGRDGSGSAAAAAEAQFVLDDEEEEDEAALAEGARTDGERGGTRNRESSATVPPLAERLLAALVDLLFVPGLTLPRSIAAEGSSTVYTIWESGIASPAPASPAHTPPAGILGARIHILRLLTLLVSLPSLLTAPGLFMSIPNRWRDALVSGRVVGQGDKNVVLCLLCSALNTALNAGALSATQVGAAANGPPASTTTFEGLRDRAARLAAEGARRTTASVLSAATGGPGRGGVQDETHLQATVAELCLQFLDVVLIEHAPPADGAHDTRANLLHHYFSRLHRPVDFELLVAGLTGFLSSALAPATSYSPFHLNLSFLTGSGADDRASPRPSSCVVEALTILARLVDSNRKFVHWLLRTPGTLLRLLVAVEACKLEWAQDETRIGLVRLASITMQTLTAEVGAVPATDELVRALNAPLEPRVVGPVLAGVVQRQLRAQGVEADAAPASDSKTEPRVFSFAEYLLISLHALVLPASVPSGAAGRDYRAALSTLYPPLLLAVNNLSGSLRDLGNEAATRLARVWLAFTAPAWVLMEEGSPRLVYYLLETFNNVAAHNLDRNPFLVYALAVSLPRFEMLANFTLAGGVAEARRARTARRERLRPISEDSDRADAGSLSRRTSTDSASAGPSAKALGKRRASSVSLSGLSLGEPALPSPALSRSGSSTSVGAASMLRGLESNDGEGGLGSADEQRPFAGRNGFIPTESWVSSWREGLPLDALLVLLSEVRHMLVDSNSNFPSTRPSSSTVASVRAHLVTPAIKSIFPAEPTAVRTRPFVPSDSSSSWLASLVYSRVYLHQVQTLRDSLPVQLFAVANAPRRTPRLGQLGAEIGNSAAQVGGRVGGVLSGVLGGFAAR